MTNSDFMNKLMGNIIEWFNFMGFSNNDINLLFFLAIGATIFSIVMAIKGKG